MKNEDGPIRHVLAPLLVKISVAASQRNLG